MLELTGYAINQCICEGRETALYRGRRLRDDLPVVIELPRADPALPTTLERLGYAYALLREYPHPGVVKMLELVRTSSSLALVFLHVEGVPLSEFMQARKFDLALTLRLAVRLTEILGQLHQHPIVHKHIKPSEVWSEAEQVRKRESGEDSRQKSILHGFGCDDALQLDSDGVLSSGDGNGFVDDFSQFRQGRGG